MSALFPENTWSSGLSVPFDCTGFFKTLWPRYLSPSLTGAAVSTALRVTGNGC